MPLDRLILLLLLVIAAAGLTIWVLTSAAGPQLLSENWLVAVPVVLLVYLVVRFIGLRRDD